LAVPNQTSSFAGGYWLREPFGFIAEIAKFTSGGGSSNGTNFADHSGWLGN
jgi:hypothetical protein